MPNSREEGEMAREKAAILIDAENQTDVDLEELMELLGDRYQVEEKHAYADWRDCRLANLARTLKRHGFKMHKAPSGYRPGVLKNTADGYMARSAARICSRRRDLEAVVLVTGDAFFCGLVRNLKHQGIRVVVAAESRRASKKLLRAADEYLPLGGWVQTLRDLDDLERNNKYVTFSFATQELGLPGHKLAHLIERDYLNQGLVLRPRRGSRPEIWLNRDSEVVRRLVQAS